MQERLEIALHEIADLTNMINELKANAAKAPLKNLEEYFTCPLYVAVFHFLCERQTQKMVQVL